MNNNNSSRLVINILTLCLVRVQWFDKLFRNPLLLKRIAVAYAYVYM